eukprot:XP_001690479.1 predicted protein [Chlamydomonas reinhardtii]
MSQGGSIVSPSVFAGLRLDSTSPLSIQEAIDQLDQYQNQVRINLFRLLHRLANQPGEALDEALGQLAAQPDKIIQESPEASILPHIATYREIVSRIKILTAEVSRKQAAEEVQKQVDEFEERLAAGGEGGGAGAGEEAEDGSEAPPRVTVESVALLQETAERCGAKLREVLDACCEEVVVVESSAPGGSGGVVTVRSALHGGATRVPDLFAALQTGWSRVFGVPFWRAAADCYISAVARPFIAANAEDAFAESLSFASGEEPYLAPAVESLARHALSSRQEKYLEQARRLLDWELADPPCGCDTSGPLLPGTGCYLVTRRAVAVVALITGLLDDACAGSRAVCRSLRGAVSSIALLARTLPPLLKHQQSAMDDLLCGLDRLRGVGTSDAKVGMRHRRVVQQLLHSLGRLGRLACDTLTPEDCVGAAAAVLNHVCGQLVAAVSAAATARCHQLRKLRCLLRVLGSDTLSAIASDWDRGYLSALAAPELEALLLAISEDSPNRRALLAKLQAAA